MNGIRFRSRASFSVCMRATVGLASLSAGTLAVLGLCSEVGAVSQVLDQISRVPDVGTTQQCGSKYAMRIWLNPDKLHGVGYVPQTHPSESVATNFIISEPSKSSTHSATRCDSSFWSFGIMLVSA